VAITTTLGGVTIGDGATWGPAYEREGYTRTAVDIGVLHEMADGSVVYDSVATRYRFRLQYNGITEAQRDAILARYIIKTSQAFSPPDTAETYTVFVVPNSWQDSYLEDSGGTRRYWCQMELVEAA